MSTNPVFEIDDYQAPEQANPFEAHVDALIKAGEGKVMTIRVATERANRDKVLFQKAANAADKTARVVSTAEDEGKGETAITFRLKPKEAARPGRGGKGKQSATESAPEAPAEAPAEAEAKPAPKRR